MDLNLSKLQEMVKDRKAWHAAVHGVPMSRTWLSDWTETEGLGPLRQVIIYDYSNKSKEKKVKETVSNMKSELASLQHNQWVLCDLFFVYII